MRKLLIGLLALTSISTFAADYCSLTRMSTGEVIFSTSKNIDSDFIMVFVSPDFKSVEVQTDKNVFEIYRKGSIVASFGKNDSKFTLSFMEVEKTLRGVEDMDDSDYVKVLVTGYDTKSLTLYSADLGMACASSN